MCEARKTIDSVATAMCVGSRFVSTANFTFEMLILFYMNVYFP